METVGDLLDLQSGVISRRQALARGLTDNDLRRCVRRRELTVVHPGVLVSHTGPLSWLQRAWAATLATHPSALSHGSALRAIQRPRHVAHDEDATIHVAVDRSRHVVAPPHVVVHRLAHLEERVLWHASPPRLRIEEALLDVASGASDQWRAIETLAGAVQGRMTTAPRMIATLQRRERVVRRRFLSDTLHDIADGTCSVLEHGYLTRVERAHALPSARRQVRASARGAVYRDVEYVRWGLIVELDGRLFHDSATARDHDLDRDLDAAVRGRSTVRLGWGQVFDRGCDTAARIAVLLHARGWAGSTRRCPDCVGRWMTVTG